MTTDLRTALRAGDPATDDRYDDAALRRKAREIVGVTGEIVTTEGSVDDLVIVLPQRTRHPRRRVVAAFVVAAVLAAGVAVVPSVLGHSSREKQQATALLDQAADAITGSDSPIRDDQYWRVSSTGLRLSQSDGRIVPAAAVLIAQNYVTYTRGDGARVYVVSGPSTLSRRLSGTPADAERQFELDSLPSSVENAGPVEGDPPTLAWPTAAFLADLPRDPAALLAAIRDDIDAQQAAAAQYPGFGGEQDPPADVATTVVDLLFSSLVPDDLRAALFRVLADLPGVEVAATNAVLNGVTGVAFAYHPAVDGVRPELVVDPATGALIGQRSVTTEPLDGIPVGTTVGESAISTEVIDRVPADVVTAAGGGGGCRIGADLTVTCNR